MQKSTKLAVIIIVFSCFLTPVNAFSQQLFYQLASPFIGKSTPSFSTNIEVLPSSTVTNQNAKFANISNKISLGFPIWQNSENEVGFDFSSSVNAIEIDGNMTLPTTKESFPNNLADIRFGPSFRRLFNNNWILSASMQTGSASDSVFAQMNDLEFIANASLMIPEKNNGYWILFLNYANNREFLSHIPLPGFGYMFPRNKYVRGIVGVPVLFLDFFPESRLSLAVSYVPIVHVKSDIKIKIYPFLNVFAGFNWKGEHFYRNERTDKSKQLFWVEKDVHLGIDFKFSRQVNFKISGGFKFDRNFFESKSIVKDTFYNRINLGNSAFCLAELGIRPNFKATKQ